MPEMGRTLPRLGFKMGPPPDGDRLSMISRILGEIMGNPRGSELPPFVSKSRLRIAQI